MSVKGADKILKLSDICSKGADKKHTAVFSRELKSFLVEVIAKSSKLTEEQVNTNPSNVFEGLSIFQLHNS